MAREDTGYFRRLWAALLGRQVELTVTTSAGEELAEMHARLATLKMDLEERDERIEQMCAEYETLEAAKERATTDAGRDEVEKLLKRISGPLATLAGLTSMAEAGDQVELADLLQLVRDLQKVLARAGLEQIGTVGERTQFDVAGHQRMSGGGVRAGTQVTIRLPGYRIGEKVLIKAMVSAEERDDG